MNRSVEATKAMLECQAVADEALLKDCNAAMKTVSRARVDAGNA